MIDVRRPSLDDTLMDVAKVWSRRATCPRLSAGAVIAQDGRQVAAGYNGAPRGLAHCTDAGCLLFEDHCIRVAHAEMNAILNAARHGVELQGATLYVTHSPCIRCSMAIVQSGIHRVIHGARYRATNDGEWGLVQDLLASARVERIQV